MSNTGQDARRKLAVVLFTAVLAITGFARSGCLVPPTACRFLRYLAASQTPEMKASLYEKIVYSLVLASSPTRHESSSRS